MSLDFNRGLWVFFVVLLTLYVLALAIARFIYSWKEENNWRLLRWVAEVSEEAPVPIMVSCGTLLGAVREGRMIPGDDDVDFQVLEEDFEEAFAFIKARLPDEFRMVSNPALAVISVKGNPFGHTDIFRLNAKDGGLYAAHGTPDLTFDQASGSEGKVSTMARGCETIEVRVPNDAVGNLRAMYGDWETPVYLGKDAGKPPLLERFRYGLTKIGIRF